MLARLQQLATLTLLSTAGLWAAWFLAEGRPVWAIAGAAMILFGYALFLGAEFAMLAFAHGDDPAPRATPTQILHAWWGEVLTAPSVFCWRQPFRSDAEPDWMPDTVNAQRGVVLVHGFVCNRGLWNPWMRRLRQAAIPHVAVNLEPVFGSIDDYVEPIDRAVRRMRHATGMAPVVVAHSMGGLATRAWLRSVGDRSRVHHIFTIGSPHHGTWLARFAWTLNGRQMGQGSDWLTTLERQEHQTPSGAPYTMFTCFYSHCDNIVFPPSTATLPGADNRHLGGSAHVHLAFHEAVYNEVRRSIDVTPPGLPGALAAQ